MRILFTGGSGKAGRHVVPYLMARGHRVLNLDLTPLDHPGAETRIADITDAGAVHDVMAGLAGFDELDLPQRPRFDAVVHFAAVPRILLTSDAECFRVNTMGTYNMIDAALRLGIRKVVIASSETTYGICFAQGERRPDYLPVDEDHPTVPEDSYALSKVLNEATARSFHARSLATGSAADIYALRINNVIEPHEYAQKGPGWVADAGTRRRNIFAYIDARDLGHMVDRCLAVNGLGFQVFNVANPDTSVALPSDQIAARFYDGVPLRRPMGRFETFYAIDKARRMLGFDPQHGWRGALGLEA
jgi:nucleoside-diphosphate-sugar epimerase